MFTSFVIFWFIFSLVISFVRGSKIPEEYIIYLVTKKHLIDSDNLKKWFVSIVIGTFFIGTVLETIRGLWFVWILSWIAFLMIILTNWRTWRYVFFDKKVDADSLNLETLPTVHDPKFFLKYVCFNFFVGIIYT